MRDSASHGGRAGRTREQLLRAFIGLVVSRGSTQVSPADVAACAGVGRSTLYTHFGGRRELLEASLVGPCTVLAGTVRAASSSSDLLPLLRHLRSQSARSRATFRDPRDPFLSLWTRCLTRALRERLRHDPDRMSHRPTIPRQWLAPVLAEVQLAIIRTWLVDPSGASTEAVADALISTTRRLLCGKLAG